MLKIPRRIWLLVFAVALIAIWIKWWASSGFPFEGQICEIADPPTNCSSYNVFFYSAWRLAKATDHWSALITAIATAVLAVITWRLITLGIEQGATTRAQLRAYLSVVIGPAVYQDRERELRFEAKPLILNNGSTPAYNVRYSIRAAIMADTEAGNFVYTEPPDAPLSQASIGPNENRVMSGIVDQYVPDEDIQDICDAKGKALYVWGVVRYDDVFKQPRYTQFAQKIWWLRDRSNVQGIYDRRFGLSN